MFLLLDGGLGHLLKARGLHIDNLPYDQQFLAGAIANVEEPAKVQECHAEYLQAGCGVITTNTFACTPHNLRKIRREADVVQLIQAAVECATAARATCDSTALIAGSVPPLQESYQTAALGSDDELLAAYRVIVDALGPAVDVLLCETLSTVQEVRCACRAASKAGKPVWVSVSINDSLDVRLRSGEPLQDAVAAALDACPGIEAFLVNCCAPAAVTAAIPALCSCLPAGVHVGGYANGFKTTTSQWLMGGPAAVPIDPGDYDESGIITVDAYTKAAATWLAEGATLVGGCCGVGPEHMRAVGALMAQNQAVA